MKLLALCSLVIALQGCADTDEVWTLTIDRPEATGCYQALRLYVTDHGGGDVAGSVSSRAGTMTVANVDDGYRVEIQDLAIDVSFVASLQRRPREGAWPDLISGTATIEGDPCPGVFGITGTATTFEEYKRSSIASSGGWGTGECSELDGEHCPINWGFGL